jgi:hypothetical protein
MKTLFVAGLSFLFLACASGPKPVGQLKSLELKPGEVIAIGRLEVLENGRDVTREATLLFNEGMWGTYPYRADESGFIYMKLRRGKNHLARISIPSGFAKFPDGYLATELSDSAKIHYIGDLRIELYGDVLVAPNYMLGALGALADEARASSMARSGRIAPVDIESGPSPVFAFFRNKFPTERETAVSLLRVHPGDAIGPDSLGADEMLEPAGR